MLGLPNTPYGKLSSDVLKAVALYCQISSLRQISCQGNVRLGIGP